MDTFNFRLSIDGFALLRREDTEAVSSSGFQLTLALL